MTLPPDWGGPPWWRVAWWRVLALARYPAVWVVAVAALLLVAGVLVGVFTTPAAGCVPRYTADGRPVATCAHRP